MNTYYVQKNLIAIILFHNLLYLGNQHIKIGRIKAKPIIML